MANSEDATRIVAACEGCGSVYAARQWPDGDIQLIGSTACSCGSTAFVLVEETDDPTSSETDVE